MRRGLGDARVAARDARNLLERLGPGVPGLTGCLERELRREVDRLLRADLAGRLDAAREAAATLGADQETINRLEQAVAAVQAAVAGRERAVLGAFGVRAGARGER
jgi:hypothetical protein